MKKQTKIMLIVIAIVVLVVAIITGVVLTKSGDLGTGKNNEVKSNFNVQSVNDLQNIVTNLYAGLEDKLPGSLNTTVIDTTDAEQFKFATGLSSSEGVEYAIMSEPMMSSQAYSLILMKVVDGVDANQIAKTMSESIDTRKWICVTAEKLYATNSGNVVCLVMASEEWARPVYENFKTIAGSIGQEYTKIEAM